MSIYIIVIAPVIESLELGEAIPHRILSLWRILSGTGGFVFLVLALNSTVDEFVLDSCDSPPPWAASSFVFFIHFALSNNYNYYKIMTNTQNLTKYFSILSNLLFLKHNYLA